ncbi:hypothetical protein GT022_17655 [Agaribacter marinus]|uniref:Uncharacterized protein n=1 Tax=Virgibacillus salarius TaxID=447199 RepID=A0A941E2W3_9BACI|nr:hypothetical protein [Virgibacillus salarius]MBR7797858.1 hypothetical protein [Virgibacillus salarius]NAZ10568.1 hypothetical protein [Agaribacter marinus]WBX81093.1 hypothetical protein PD280_04795 [Virgibacillus salarius]
MEHNKDINLQYVVNSLTNQISTLTQEKAYLEAIVTSQQEEANKLREELNKAVDKNDSL